MIASVLGWSAASFAIWRSVVEPKLEIGFVGRNAVDIRSDLGDGGLAPLLSMFIRLQHHGVR
jgi:hypothetical protein